MQAALDRIGLSQRGFARAAGTGDRTIRGYVGDERAIPGPVAALLWAMERDPALAQALTERHQQAGPDSASDK